MDEVYKDLLKQFGTTIVVLGFLALIFYRKVVDALAKWLDRGLEVRFKTKLTDHQATLDQQLAAHTAQLTACEASASRLELARSGPCRRRRFRDRG